MSGGVQSVGRYPGAVGWAEDFPNSFNALIFKDNKAESQVITATDAAGAAQKFKSYGFFGENRHFIDCLKEGRLPETNFGDATRTMELVNRIYGSQI